MLSGPVPPRPLTVLRAELQSLRHLDLRQPHWTKTLLEALESSLMAEGPLRTVELIIREVLQASVIDLGNSAGDPLEHFAVALLSLRFSPTSPMPTVATFILQYLPSLFDSGSTALTGNLPSQSTPYATTALARLIKQSLLATADIHPADEGRSVADALVDHMIEELRYQGSRPVAQADVQSGKKAPKVVRAGRVMSAVQKEMLDGLCGLFEGDEEMRSRWPQLIGGFGNA